MNLLPNAPSQASSDEPLYNIGVVTRMTNISMATLRAWERRYDFPEARRTAGGHRLYSEKDILRLRWVKARIEEGMQTAQAISALHHQEVSSQFISEIGTGQVHTQLPEETQTFLELYQDQLFHALVQRDTNKADAIIGEALAASNPEDLIVHVMAPTLARIGDAWEQNSISVSTEHLTTNYLRQRLLMWMINSPLPQAQPTIVLACAPDEWHEGSLLIFGALLRRRRWPVAYLGQAVPLADLASFVKEIRPQAVVLVAMTEETVVGLVEWPQVLPDIAQGGRPFVCYGGRVFVRSPEWQERVPGIYLGDTFLQGLEKLEYLLKNP